MTFAGLALGALALAILLFMSSLLVARRVLKRRTANVVGPYLVRIGSAKGRGRDGVDLATQFDSLDEARSAASAALLEHPDDDVVAHVLGRRPDDEWDVIDRVDVLTH